MPDEINLPRWFLLVKKVCYELSLGLGSAYAFLRFDGNTSRSILKGLYDPITMCVFALLIICTVFSCHDFINRFNKNGKQS